MILSYRHRFIFVHLPKTAGSSVAAYLSRYLGPWDIYLGSVGDARRYGGRINIRTRLDHVHPRSLKDTAKRLIIDRRFKLRQKPMYRPMSPATAHARASEIQSYYPQAWDRSFVFCFTRNPWERLVSLYRWQSRSRNMPAFTEFLEMAAHKPERYLSSPAYTIDGRIAVDFIGRYEYLHEDLCNICERIGLPFESGLLPHAKDSPAYDYREYYGAKHKDLVASICRDEIEMFGYEF
ncbi:MAG: sulfotransferase family 2 domain-containing protein [Gammaproteobacteria bacterium]|nr:sulfotransferase family 2 domain-containing protein [Gammaproteobacteria bacterium]